MEIFYLKKSEFLPFINYDSLKAFSDGREFKSAERETEHLCSIFLTKFIAKHIYDISNTDIEICGKKPFFKKREIYFSISHSQDIVLAAFNNSNIGSDIEYMQDRTNFNKIMMRYGENTQAPPTKTEFYRFWTVHEAEIKLNSHIKSLFSEIIEKDYMFSCVSDDIFVSNFCIKKLTCAGKNINLVEELDYTKNLRLSIQRG